MHSLYKVKFPDARHCSQSILLVTMSPQTLSLGLLCLIALTQLAHCGDAFYRHSRSRDLMADASEQKFRYEPADLQPAASGHYGHGRVHIKVYRGPSDGHHAPHGYWVKQPADD